MVTIKKTNGEIVILGTSAENLLIWVLDWCVKSKFSPLMKQEIDEAKFLLKNLKG